MLILDPMTRCPPASMTVAHRRRSLLITDSILYQHNLVEKADRRESIDWVEVNIQCTMLK